MEVASSIFLGGQTRDPDSEPHLPAPGGPPALHRTAPLQLLRRRIYRFLLSELFLWLLPHPVSPCERHWKSFVARAGKSGWRNGILVVISMNSRGNLIRRIQRCERSRGGLRFLAPLRGNSSRERVSRALSSGSCLRGLLAGLRQERLPEPRKKPSQTDPNYEQQLVDHKEELARQVQRHLWRTMQ
jgi:hypothetical protein